MTRTVPVLLLLATAIAADEGVIDLGSLFGVRFVAAGGAGGGTGFARIEFVNKGTVARSVSITLREQNGNGIRIRREGRVAAGGTSVVFLPMPGHARAYRLSVSGPGFLREFPFWQAYRSRASVLALASDKVLADHRRVVLRAAAGLGGRHDSRRRWQQIQLSALPPDWRMLTGFHQIVASGTDEGWTAQRQATVVAATHAGARLFVFSATSLPDGPLRKLVLGSDSTTQAGGLRSGRHGFGRFATVAVDAEALQRRVSDRGPVFLPLRHWLIASSGGRFGERERWLPEVWNFPPDVPGVGDVPRRAFFLLILGFAILVGPVAYLWLRRRRRLTLLVAILPVSGFALTAAILLFGFLSEGFGIKGALRSVTLLDQRTHIAVTTASQTLYAGLSPSKLEPDAQTHLECPSLDSSRSGHVLAIRDGVIDGTLVPSRTETSLVTITRGRARERIRFRRRGGTVEVLADEGFAPVRGALLLRGFDGAWWRDRGDGVLEPLREPAASEALAKLRAPLWELRARRIRPPYDADLAEWLAKLVDSALEPGTYVARVRSLPSLDTFGLGVEYLAREHLVVGRLGPEDFTE